MQQGRPQGLAWQGQGNRPAKTPLPMRQAQDVAVNKSPATLWRYLIKRPGGKGLQCNLMALSGGKRLQ